MTRKLAVLVVAACGSSSQTPHDAMIDVAVLHDVAIDVPHDTLPPDAGADIGFDLPTAGVHANTEVTSGTWMDLGPADLSCLGTASGDQATTVAVTLSTTVKDFQTQNPIAGALVTAFADIDVAHPFDTETSDSAGNVAIAIPIGTRRFGVELKANQVTTFDLHHIASPDIATQTAPPLQSMSDSTAATLPALIGETRIPGTALAVGVMRDCQHHEMSSFVATASSTPVTAMPISGAEAFYFSASVGLPVHHNQQDSASADGLFMIIQVPATPIGYVQIWGFPTDAAVASGQMTLLAQLAVPMPGDSVSTSEYEPLRN